MPTFQITGPDGKSYRIDGDNAAGALDALHQHLGDTTSPKLDPRDSFMGKVDSAVRGAADTMSLGFADEVAAGLGTGFGYLGDYDAELARQRGIDKSDADNRFGYRLGGQLAGGLTGGVGLARNGLSMTANAVNRGAGLGRVAATSAGESAMLGGAGGFGSGEGVDDRLKKAAIGMFSGAGLGVAAPLAVAGIQQFGGMIAAPLAARMFPEGYAQRAIGDTLRRSGTSVDAIVDALRAARADGQDMFTVADALGNEGRRQISTVAKNPSDARQAVIEALQSRQVGQGDRLASYLADGFAAPDTAAQRAASLTAQRTATANANYGAAREAAGVVDPTAAIAAADDFLTPGATRLMNPGNSIADDSIEAAVRRARGYLTDGNSVLTDFNASLRSKQELDAMIDGARPAVQRQLIPIRNALDDALADASQPYAAARDAFRQQSRAIDAVETGRAATSGRVRADDTIQWFNVMSPEEQSAFRAGYADPLIARTEAASASPLTNKARPLITPKTGAEFPAFAAPGRGDQMGNRIAREQTMFETSRKALGGSETSENLADAAELSKFDPGVMSALMRMDVPGAIMGGLRAMGNEASGTPPRVIEHLARVLMETSPDAARAALQGGQQNLSRQNAMRAKVVAALIASGSAGAARFTP